MHSATARDVERTGGDATHGSRRRRRIAWLGCVVATLATLAPSVSAAWGDPLPPAPDGWCTGAGGTVRVSSNVNPATYPAWAAPNVFDGQTASVSSSLGWHSQLGVTSPTAGECVAVDLGSTQTLSRVTLHAANPPGRYFGFGFPVDYRIEVSDFSNFAYATTVASVTDAPLPTGAVKAHLATPTAARYVRVVVTKARAITATQYAVALAEVAADSGNSAPAPDPLPGLEGWYDALAEKGTRRVNVLVVGDSISESTWNPIPDRYMNVLQRRINQHYGLPYAEFSYIPAYYATPAPPVQAPVSWAGSLAAVNFGLGLRATQTATTGSSTFTFTGTRARLVFTQAPNAAVARIVIDGGTPLTLDTATSSIVESGLTWDSGPLSAGPHTIVVSRDASSAAGRLLWLDGAYVENGDAGSGVHFLDSAHNGYSTSHFTTARPAFRKAVARAAAVNGGIDLIIWALGTNDRSANVGPAAFKSRHDTFISDFESDFGFDGSQLFVAVPKSSVFSQESWDPYVTAMEELATAHDGAFVNLGELMPQPGAADATGLYYDSVHPTPHGYDVMTQFLGPILDPATYWDD